MAELRVHQSNRLERLADVLAEICALPLRSPLDAERIVVPNTGMARWLSLALADRLDVCANVRFPLPAELVWEVWRAVLEHVPEEPALPAPVLAWRIYSLLGDVDVDPALAPLARYLNEADDLQRFELAQHIGLVFDQYLVYRPEMIVSWEEDPLGRRSHDGGPPSPDEAWQAELWRRVVRGGRPRHRARLALEFAQIPSARLSRADLPERVLVFGIPGLAPIHLQSLARLSEVTDVHLLVVNPCREFWEDILPPSDIARLCTDVDPAELYYESGNPLLASMGRQGRDFISMLTPWQGHGADAFEPPVPDGQLRQTLHVLQSDILDLRTRDAPAVVDDDDRSVQIHVCHSPMREVEVLHDQLLDLFRRHPDLEPAAVRVMTPDIEAYAPLIDSVFGTATGRRRIPYAIADRQPRTERSTVAAFVALLQLPESRYDATRLLALLETESVRRRFDLEEGDVPRLAQWVRACGIRWGIDTEHRASLGLPPIPENTWRFGLDRLLLGHAMAGGGEVLFDGILPYDDVEGTDVRLMALLQLFASAVFDAASELSQNRTAEGWQQTLAGLLDRFFAGTEADLDLETIRDAIARFADETRRAGCTQELSLRLVAYELERLLREPGGAWAFLSGSVTFCTMVPMRNIPADVVCLLGMNDQAYPRSRRPPSFDLIAQRPRKGDRSRRDDDRYLFLEALLSARRTFYASYVGRSIRDNGEIPPSTLVAEITEAIRSSCRRRGSDAPSTVTTIHPLQPFSPHYFSGDDDLWSYVGELCEAAEAARGGARDAPTAPFVRSALPAPDESWLTVHLEALLRFYRNPVRYFLRDRLGVLLDEKEALIEETEPFRLEGLGLYHVRERLLELALAGRPKEEIEVCLRASGDLPHGLVGRHALDDLHVQVERVARRVRPLLHGEPLPPVTVDAELAGVRLVGALADVRADGLLEYGFDAPGGRDHLSLWLRHLALNLVRPPGVEPRSRHVWGEGTLELGPIADAERHLADLLTLYRCGLERPLRLYPDLSLLHFRDKRELAPDDLTRTWDRYPAVVFRGRDPGGEEFAALARRVFAPIERSAVHDG